jgi:hypothetical protein
MNQIIIGFSSPKKWMPYAALIKLLYGTSYDHVYIRIYSGSYQRDLIYQASKTLLNFMSPEVFAQSNNIIQEFAIGISKDDKIKVMQFAIDNAGKPYGIMEAIGIGIIKIASFFGKKINNPFNEGTNSYVCSTLAAYVLKTYLNKNIEDFQNYSPQDIYNLLNKKEV